MKEFAKSKNFVRNIRRNAIPVHLNLLFLILKICSEHLSW
jgi:hypothetical protein